MADPDNLIIQIILEKNEKKEKCKTQEEKGIIHIQYYLYIRPPCLSGSSVRLVSPPRPGPVAVSAGVLKYLRYKLYRITSFWGYCLLLMCILCL